MISENPVDESEPGIDANRESAQQSGHSKPAVPPAPPTPKLPPTPTQHYQPDRRKDNTPPWKKRGEIAAIIIAFGLLVVNTFALPTVKKAADAAKSAADTARLTLQQSVETFRIGERAWVEIEPIKPNLFTARTPQFGASFNYDIYPKNVGKTAAHNITVKAETTSSSVEFGTHADWIGNVQDKLLLNKFTEMGTGKPVIIASNPVPKILAPGAVAPVPFTPHAQEPQIFSKDEWVSYLIGRIDYIDQFKVSHWMKFCFFVANRRGELWSCKEGNEEDDNLETPEEKTHP